MTPTQLREIAERLETTCFQLRSYKQEFWRSKEWPACDGCKAAARELRELAETMESANVPGSDAD